MADKKDDLEMFRFLDALMEFDPSEDAEFMDVAEEANELEMHESDEPQEEEEK